MVLFFLRFFGVGAFEEEDWAYILKLLLTRMGGRCGGALPGRLAVW